VFARVLGVLGSLRSPCARSPRGGVLSLPFALRVPLAWHHDLALAVLGAAARAIEAFYRERARALGIEHGRTGSITVIQRFGSDLALNVHFHILFLDGVYDARGRFTPLPAPTKDELHELTTRIAERITRLCERRALDADLLDTERALCAAFARSAARRGATAHAPEDSDPDLAPDLAVRLKARVDGFDLDATTVVRAEDRERLEHLCRYLLRPPLADRRLRLLPGDQVALELKTPWRDGTRWLTMSADTFLERLCSLVPRPNTHQVIHRGVLASHAAWRPRVVPRPDDDELGPRSKNATFCALMKHGLGLDVLACLCGGRMKYVATIFDRRGLQRLLRAKGLPHLIEHARPARAPPQAELDFGA
jgi:hypothetical protein